MSATTSHWILENSCAGWQPWNENKRRKRNLLMDMFLVCTVEVNYEKKENSGKEQSRNKVRFMEEDEEEQGSDLSIDMLLVC
jgi:hypothetical protein